MKAPRQTGSSARVPAPPEKRSSINPINDAAKQATFHERARETSVVGEFDVVVCGGGPAGVGAAVAAARNGARTLLIESQTCLGGMATAGMVNRLGPYHDQKQIILGGIPWEVLRALVDRGLAQEPKICAPKDWMSYWLVFDPEGMKLVLDRLVEEAGVKVLLAAQVVAPIARDGVIDGVIVESKSGRQAILGKTFVDCTGDGDVAARAGVPFEIGREGDRLMQPVTLFFKCLNMDWPRALDYVRRNRAELLKHAREDTGNDVVLAGTDSYLHPEETYFNELFERGVDGTDAWAMSQAAMRLREKMWKNIAVLRRYVPGCDRISLIASASALGVRETRRFACEYTLQLEDVLEGRQFDDQVCRYACFIDINEPKANEKSADTGRELKPGASYGVPYRCLVPRGMQNLLIAGRCISASHEALASVRMMPCCLAMGQAAGTAAAMSMRDGVPPRRLDPKALRARLAGQGVLI